MSRTALQCGSCQNLQKRVRVLQADCEFEIKKISQDKSTQKAMFELSTNRQIKKLNQKCQRERQQRLRENQNWMKKYDQLSQRKNLEMNEYRRKTDQQTRQFRQVKDGQVESFKKQQISKLQMTIQNIKVQRDNLLTQLTEKHQNEISQLKITQDDKIAKLIKKYEELMKKKYVEYEAVFLGVQSEKNVQESLHKKTKQESRQSQAKLLQQIYGLKRIIYDHEERMELLKNDIQQKNISIESLKEEIIRRQTEHSQKYQLLSKNYEDKYISNKSIMQKKLQIMFKKQLQNCFKYEKALQKIQEHREIQNKMYKANLNDIKDCVEQRPSRLQDIQQIMKLRERLLQKQRQCQSMSEQLKFYKLQLQNKQQTYNKIFGPDSKNNENTYIRRKDLKLKRAGKSVSGVRQILGAVNNTNNYLAPLVGNIDKKTLLPKQNKIL